MKLFFYFCLLIIISEKTINSGASPCFEYSCDECLSEEYGTCTKCRSGWTLVDGTCPCYDSTCALCANGLAGLHICYLCKYGYYRFWNDCYCQIDNCEQCSANSCIKCTTGYSFNSITHKCEKLEGENKIDCFDKNCDSCFSKEQGACLFCKDGFSERKGECFPLLTLDENSTCPDGYYSSGNKCLEKCSGVNCSVIYRYPDYFSCSSNNCLICVSN